MTRKHFKIIADEIKYLKDKDKAKTIAIFLADILWKCNPMLMRGKFLEACGVEDDTNK